MLSVGDRERGMVEICEEMRKDLAKYPEIKTFKVIEGGQEEGMGGQNAVDIEIYGFDFGRTDAVAAELAERMRKVKGCSQVNISREDYIPEYQVDFDREKLAINGLNITTAAMALRNRINGSTASKYREDGDEYDIKVRYAPEFRQSVEDIENILVYNNAGQGIRIRDLGKVVERMTPPTIERKDRERVITVSAVVGKGAAMSDIVTAARNQLKEMDIPSDVSWQLGGTYEDQMDTFFDLTILMVLIIILVFIVMAAQFESLTDPFVIMFSIRLHRYNFGTGNHTDPIGRYGIDRPDYADGDRCQERYRADRLHDPLPGKRNGNPDRSSDCRKIPPPPCIDDHFDYRIGYDPDGCRNRRRLGNVAFDGYDGCMGTFGVNIDHPGNRTGRIQCICRKRSPAQTPQDGKKWNIF